MDRFFLTTATTGGCRERFGNRRAPGKLDFSPVFTESKRTFGASGLEFHRASQKRCFTSLLTHSHGFREDFGVQKCWLSLRQGEPGPAVIHGVPQEVCVAGFAR